MTDAELVKHISEAIANWKTGGTSSYDTVTDIEALLAERLERQRPIIPPEMIG